MKPKPKYLINTRSDKELLQLLLDNIDRLKTGLCGLATYQLKLYGEELEQILKYIKAHKPRTYYARNHTYCWVEGWREPRIKWLEKQIKRLSK